MQIRLDNAEYTLAKKTAAGLGIPVAEFGRRSVRAALPIQKDAPWMKYAGMVSSANPLSSRTIDCVVYGTND